MMEPMTLGSAPSSPSSPGVNPNFLPAFLMGDTSQPSTPGLTTSPGRNRTPSALRKYGQLNTTGPDSRNAYPKLYNQSSVESPLSSTQQFTPHKPGPPNQGLFDTLEHRRKPTHPVMNSTSIPFTNTPSISRNISGINDDSSASFCKNMSNLNETINRSGNFSRMDRIDTHWVTVYGFPPSALSLVLAQLSNCGVIVEKRLPTQGNWVHVKFNNLNDVPRALALNGRCINSQIMIGVILYHNKEDKENENVFTSPSRARSLRQSFVSPSSSETVLLPQNVPQKSTGLVSKAIEYVFGW